MLLVLFHVPKGDNSLLGLSREFLSIRTKRKSDHSATPRFQPRSRPVGICFPYPYSVIHACRSQRAPVRAISQGRYTASVSLERGSLLAGLPIPETESAGPVSGYQYRPLRVKSDAVHISLRYASLSNFQRGNLFPRFGGP